MSLYSRVIKSASVLALSQVAVAACTFIRNIIIARHITTEHYGIATTFAVTISLVEMTSNLALDRVLVQDNDGDTRDMLASAHMMQFFKGLIMGLILFLIAGPVAHLFELPELIGAFQILAVIPIIQGLMHFDIVVRQRKMDFNATAVYEAIPHITSVLTAYIAATYLRDYRVMLVVMVFHALLQMVISHLLAKQPYRWVFKRDLARKKLDFGWPLLVNGVLLFGIFQGDRVIIGTMYDMHTLGWYSVAFSLCLLPTLIFAKMSGYLFMPILSRSREDPALYERCCRISLASCFCFAVFMVSFFAIAGQTLISLSYGAQYLEATSVILWLAIMQGLRVIRIAPSVIANSQAKTKNGMYSNIFRSTTLLLALAFAVTGKSVVWIAFSGILGEVFALIFSVYLLDLGVFKRRFVARTIQFAGGFLLILAPLVYYAPKAVTASSLGAILTELVLGGFAAILASVLLALSDPLIRREILQLYGDLRKGLFSRRGIGVPDR